METYSDKLIIPQVKMLACTRAPEGKGIFTPVILVYRCVSAHGGKAAKSCEARFL